MCEIYVYHIECVSFEKSVVKPRPFLGLGLTSSGSELFCKAAAIYSKLLINAASCAAPRQLVYFIYDRIQSK